LVTYRNPGFWVCMDTLKEKRLLDEMFEHGNAPWALWRSEQDTAQQAPAIPRKSKEAILLDRSHLVARHRGAALAAGAED
jgi:hypothetical protein